MPNVSDGTLFISSQSFASLVVSVAHHLQVFTKTLGNLCKHCVDSFRLQIFADRPTFAINSEEEFSESFVIELMSRYRNLRDSIQFEKGLGNHDSLKEAEKRDLKTLKIAKDKLAKLSGGRFFHFISRYVAACLTDSFMLLKTFWFIPKSSHDSFKMLKKFSLS